jgi:hypothetical protein
VRRRTLHGKYLINGTETRSCWKVIRATSEAEARQIAEQEDWTSWETMVPDTRAITSVVDLTAPDLFELDARADHTEEESEC